MAERLGETPLSLEDQELIGLIAETAGGSEQAFGRLYDRTSAFVHGLAIRVLDDAAAAEEVTLDVYMQVWKQARAFDYTRGKPIVWLTMLARSRAIDRLRSGRKEREGRRELKEVEENPDPTGADPESTCVQSQERELVCRALRSLAPEQREVIELAYFGGFTHSEIADQTGQPLGTVKTRARLGMMRLRDWLQPFHEGLAS